MFEKVNPSHPDKLADRIAGAIVDIAYENRHNPRIAVEVLIGHGVCHVIVESGLAICPNRIKNVVKRIAGENVTLDLVVVEQDKHLQQNQMGKMRCGDNGIFRSVPVTQEQELLTSVVKNLYKHYPFDGKMVYEQTTGRLVICQSNVPSEKIQSHYPNADVNPLGDWTGGPNVDTGATNRKLGSDMADSATGGGLHGKDLSKADVSVNIYAWLKAQHTGKPVELTCAIGDEYVDGIPFSAVVEIARDYIDKIGGFEKFAEWGLLR